MAGAGVLKYGATQNRWSTRTIFVLFFDCYNNFTAVMVPRTALRKLHHPRISSGSYNRSRPDLLLEWVPLLCPELVKRSLERPLVSGFYRLVTLVFRETARAGYFDPPSLSNAGASMGSADDSKVYFLVFFR